MQWHVLSGFVPSKAGLWLKSFFCFLPFVSSPTPYEWDFRDFIDKNKPHQSKAEVGAEILIPLCNLFVKYKVYRKKQEKILDALKDTFKALSPDHSQQFFSEKKPESEATLSLLLEFKEQIPLATRIFISAKLNSKSKIGDWLNLWEIKEAINNEIPSITTVFSLLEPKDKYSLLVDQIIQKGNLDFVSKQINDVATAYDLLLAYLQQVKEINPVILNALFERIKPQYHHDLVNKLIQEEKALPQIPLTLLYIFSGQLELFKDKVQYASCHWAALYFVDHLRKVIMEFLKDEDNSLPISLFIVKQAIAKLNSLIAKEFDEVLGLNPEKSWQDLHELWKRLDASTENNQNACAESFTSFQFPEDCNDQLKQYLNDFNKILKYVKHATNDGDEYRQSESQPSYLIAGYFVHQLKEKMKSFLQVDITSKVDDLLQPHYQYTQPVALFIVNQAIQKLKSLITSLVAAAKCDTTKKSLPVLGEEWHRFTHRSWRNHDRSPPEQFKSIKLPPNCDSVLKQSFKELGEIYEYKKTTGLNDFEIMKEEAEEKAQREEAARASARAGLVRKFQTGEVTSISRQAFEENFPSAKERKKLKSKFKLGFFDANDKEAVAKVVEDYKKYKELVAETQDRFSQSPAAVNGFY